MQKMSHTLIRPDTRRTHQKTATPARGPPCVKRKSEHARKPEARNSRLAGSSHTCSLSTRLEALLRNPPSRRLGCFCLIARVRRRNLADRLRGSCTPHLETSASSGRVRPRHLWQNAPRKAQIRFPNCCRNCPGRRAA